MFLLLGACVGKQETAVLSQKGPQQGLQQTENADSDTPSWVPDMLSGNGPWNGNLWLATSSDGLTFTKDSMLVEHVGVPNLLLTSSGELIATYQYFSYETQ